MLRAVLFGIITASTSFAWSGPDPVIIPNVTQSTGAVRTETVEIANGGELVTFFERIRGGGQTARDSEMPLLAVLRDTLGDADPANDRLRQVWVFTYTAPSPAQRIAGSVPFFYHRSGLDSGSSTRPPRPLLDMARPAHALWSGIAFPRSSRKFWIPLAPSPGSPHTLTAAISGNIAELTLPRRWTSSPTVRPK
jgi:hypothetical protein